MGSLLHMM